MENNIRKPHVKYLVEKFRGRGKCSTYFIYVINVMNLMNFQYKSYNYITLTFSGDWVKSVLRFVDILQCTLSIGFIIILGDFNRFNFGKEYNFHLDFFRHDIRWC